MNIMKEKITTKRILKSFQNCINSEDDDCNELVVTQNTKINRLIEEINIKYTRKQIAVLFLEIADKPEICTDFNISLPYYLRKYLLCPEEVCLSQTGVFILSAAKIYSRRVDSIFDNIQQMLAGIEKSSKELDKSNLEKNNENSEKSKEPTKPGKRPPKRSLPKDDALYESEIEPKLFKKASDDKICDRNLIVNIFEPPQNYFRSFRKYLDYRANNKKIQKDNSKHDESADPSLYKYSTIEDFDYEDDIDSKRNYRTLHGHIEHRYSTIVPDINFLMHFKVKDFVEKELEEMERQLSLGLPQTPKRKWYSLCHNEYINGLLDLENEILEKEFDTNITFFKRRRKVNEINDGKNINLSINLNDEIENNTNLEEEAFDISNTNKPEGGTNCDKHAIFNQEENKMNEKIVDLAQNFTHETINSLSLKEKLKEGVENSDMILDEMHENKILENSCSKNLITSENPNESIKDNEIIDPKKIIVRLSCDDEGIFLSDLDDIQTAMINPKVIAVDIRKSIDRGFDSFSINLDKTLESFLGVDEIIENYEREVLSCPLNIAGIRSEFLNHQEDFALPLDLLVKETPIILNIFDFPEKKIKASKIFYLPEEYNIFKNDRLKKRTPIEKSPRVTKDTSAPLICSTPTISIQGDIDFLGFSQEEIDSNILTREKIDERQRTISTDSGIVISKTANIFSSTLISHISQNDSIFNETMEENLSKIISTISQNEPTKLLGNNIVETSDLLNSTAYSAKVLEVQTIVPPHMQECEKSKEMENGQSKEIENEKDKETVKDDTQLNKEIRNIDDNTTDFQSNNMVNDDTICDDASDENLFRSEDCLENMRVTEKIKLWHKHLKPILVKSKGRHHFDVFNLGTEIMNKFSAKNNNTIDFCAVMENKDPSFTSRYFLSMLLLANANNIKLNVKNKNTEKPIPPNDIEIVLLSTTRHTVSVEDNIGIANKKNKITTLETNVQFLPKPSKNVKKSAINEDNDSGFFSSLSSISAHNIVR